MNMDKRKQKNPAICENRDTISNPMPVSRDLIIKERHSKDDGLQVREFKAAIGVILEVHNSLLKDNSAVERTETVTRMTVNTAEFVSHSRSIFTPGSVTEIEDISVALQQVEHNNPNPGNQDFLQRLSRLSAKINRQLAGLQETIRTNGKAADRLSGSVKIVTKGLGIIKGECSEFKLKPEPES